MLPVSQRLTSPSTFREVVRRGHRCGGPLLVVHLHLPATAADPVSSAPLPARAGLVVSKAVGTAVTRNLVKRRLRHLVREHLDELPPGTLLVLRALPPSAHASYAELASELTRCLAGCRERVA